MDSVTRPRVYRFERFTLDLARGCLRSGERELELRPKSFEVLRYLVEHPDRLIGRDELISAIWPTVHVTEESLTRCISDVRNVLSDTGQDIIKTAPRRGYVFAAPVAEVVENGAGVPAQTGPATAEASPAGPGPRTRRRRWQALAAVSAALLAAIVVVGLWVWRAPAGLPLPDRPSIAVLPFEHMGSDRAQEYFTDGLTEDLITALSKFSQLFVIARNSTFTYKGRHVETKQIGRELGVRYLVQGSVRRHAERIRITAQLVEASTGKQIWAESYDREIGALFAVQDDVTQRILRTLVAHITQSELDRSRRKPPETLAAYDYYLRGNAMMAGREGEHRGERVAAAREFYRQSLQFDPHYAPAVQGMASTYVTAWLEPTTYAPLVREHRQKATIDQAFALAQRAVELDPHLPEAHATLAWVLHWQYRRNEALTAFARAIELNPNLADGRPVLMLYQNGRAAEAIEMMKRVMRLEPFPPAVYLSYLGNAYYLAGQYENAYDATTASAKRLPGYRPSFVWSAAAAAQLGRKEEARAAAAEVRKIQPDFTISWFLGQIRLARAEDAEHLAQGLRKAGLPD